MSGQKVRVYCSGPSFVLVNDCFPFLGISWRHSTRSEGKVYFKGGIFNLLYSTFCRQAKEWGTRHLTNLNKINLTANKPDATVFGSSYCRQEVSGIRLISDC